MKIKKIFEAENMKHFTISNILKDLTSSKCPKGEENQDLDIFEFFKFFSIIMCLVFETALCLKEAPLDNLWRIVDYFKYGIFAMVLSAQVAVESFYFYSAFLFSYKIFKMLDDNQKRYLTIKDIGRFYLKKYLRLAPAYYSCLFIGWSICAFLSNAPTWSFRRSFWYDCNSRWWAQLLFIGNLVGFQNTGFGCMYWVWSIQCDLQLALLVPLIV